MKNLDILKLKFCKLVSTFFYVGLCPIAPGTAGSLAGVMLIYFLPTHIIFFNIVAIVVLLLVGVATSGYIENALKISDPSWIVIDEVLGIFLVCFWLPKDWKAYFLAFILFRFFDITKPFPIKSVEKIRAPGWGIMLDDVVAAAYASAILMFII